MKKIKATVAFLLATFMVSVEIIPLLADTVSPGQSFSASLSCGANEGTVSVVGSNATVTGGSNWCERGGTVSATATAGGEGTATVTLIAGSDLFNVSDPATPVQVGEGSALSSSSVSVVAPTPTPDPGNGGETPNPGTEEPSEDPTKKEEEPKKEEEEKSTKDSTSTLSSLKISVGKLSPAFNETQTSYDVTLPAGTSKVSVSATPKKETSTVEGTGDIELSAGIKNVEIICSAEDGTSTTYNIKFNVAEKPITYAKYKGKKLGILNESTDVPKLFTQTKIKIDGKEVIAWENKTLKMTLVYMINEKTNAKDLYLYDTKKNEATSIYKPFAYQGKNLVMIDVPKELQERKGMKFTTVKLGKNELPGWTFKEKAFKDYALLYVMDETGKTVYYQYEKKQDSLQLYSQAAAITQKKYESELKKQNFFLMTTIGLGVLSILLLIVAIVVFVKRKKPTKFKKIPVDNQSMSAEAKSLIQED